ncbi:hypothetical protein [Herbidospora daliensis]|uniref:hypothetical protein n=1 Tax=Herbidospora daliensis TaxID=295585 RepID=UPI000784317E|nr:hypothetical protein [Herbidospora daliensis]
MSRTIHHVPAKHRRTVSTHWIFALRSHPSRSRITRTVVIRLYARVHGDPSIARWAAESHQRRRAADRVTARTALHLLRADPAAEIEFADPRHRRAACWLA